MNDINKLSERVRDELMGLVRQSSPSRTASSAARNGSRRRSSSATRRRKTAATSR